MPGKAAVLALIVFSISVTGLPAQAAPASKKDFMSGNVPQASVEAVAAASGRLIGDAYPKGGARVFLAGRWLDLKGVCPAAPGEVFTTSSGTISILFKDGTRMEVGRRSAVALKEAPGAPGAKCYVVALLKGRVGINGGGLSKLRVLTPDELMLEPGKDGFTGGLFFDGGRIVVKTLSGRLIAKKVPAAKKGAVRYADVKALGGGVQGSAAGGTGGGADPGEGAGGGAGGALGTGSAFAIGGGALLAGTIAGVTAGNNSGRQASPYSP